MKRAKRKMVHEYHEFMGDKGFKILTEVLDQLERPYYLVQLGDDFVVDGEGTDSEGKNYITELTTFPMSEYDNIIEFIKLIDAEFSYSVFSYYTWLEDTGRVVYG